MMKKLLKTIMLSAVALAISSQLFGVGVAAEEVKDYEAKPDSYYNYVQDFTDVNSVNNAFHSYYLENALGSAAQEQVSADPNTKEAHWVIDGGVLKRVNNVETDEITGKHETNKLAVLSFTKEAYLNFELSIDCKRGNSGFWPVIGIRQLEEGKYYLDDGAGVFVQQNGKITLWGDQVVSGPYEFGQVEKYVDGEWYNMQIKVLGNLLSVSVNNTPWQTQVLPDGFYDTGYVSLISVNNETQYKNFRIKALAEPEKDPIKNFDPTPEASTDDALSNMAGEVKDADELFEREGKVNGDLIYDSTVTVKGGCVGVGSAGSALSLAALALAAVLKKKH